MARIVLSINAAWNIVNFRAGLIAALRAEGHELAALAPRDAHVARLEAMGVRFVPLAMDRKGTSPAADALLFLRYYAALRRIRPGLFLGWTAKPNVYGSLAAHALGIPVINNVSGLGTAFIREGLLTRIVKRLYRIALARSHAVFFQNEEDLDAFVAEGLVARAKARLLPGSGIDLVRFAPVPRDRQGGVAFLLVARLLRDKGVGEYVEAARMLKKERPELSFRLLGFLDPGNRSAVSRAELDAWIAEGVIEYLGEADDVRPHLAAADCIVLPSYREGMPRTLLEGAATGLPMVATDVPGCRQLVADGVDGFLCAPGDAASLAGAMRKMADLSPGERAAMGRAARAKVEAEYDERIVVGRYLEAIGETLGGRAHVPNAAH